MKPYFQDDAVTIYHADCREILPQLEPVDLVLTDPPYNVSKVGGDILYRGGGKAKTRDFGAWDGEWHPMDFLSQSASIVRPGGTLLAFTSDRLLGEYRSHTGWTQRGTLVWLKTNPPPVPRPVYVQATEWVVWLVIKGGKVTWNAGGYILNVLTYPICGGNERSAHPTQKPLGLLHELTLRHSNTGDLILDPFMGSGTTLRAAKDLGRKAIGIEIEEKYCEIAAQRMAQMVMPL